MTHHPNNVMLFYLDTLLKIIYLRSIYFACHNLSYLIKMPSEKTSDTQKQDSAGFFGSLLPGMDGK